MYIMYDVGMLRGGCTARYAHGPGAPVAVTVGSSARRGLVETGRCARAAQRRSTVEETWKRALPQCAGIAVAVLCNVPWKETCM